MTIRRYARTTSYNFGRRYGTSKAILIIRNGIDLGRIRSETYITKQEERLDIIAGQYYGDGTLWWVISAASNVGWAAQVPPNTRLTIPNLQDVAEYVG